MFSYMMLGFVGIGRAFQARKKVCKQASINYLIFDVFVLLYCIVISS